AVEIGYGRIGSAGRSRRYVVRDKEEARRLVQIILKRRATAPRRIGVAYLVRELLDPEEWAGSYEGIAAGRDVRATESGAKDRMPDARVTKRVLHIGLFS
ncbi:MAG TPA: hypothetical protein VKP69_32315, partial [Isosphaeraceae bacterium]|nr:hypothetical protein [Isosphaeraceae bacterium]